MSTAPQKTRSRRRWALRIAILFLFVGAANVGVWWFLKLRSVPYRVTRLEDQARLEMRLGKWEDAAKTLEAAAKLMPENAGLAVQLAGALDAARRGEEAERVLRAALSRAPQSAAPAVALAGKLLARGEAAEAAALLEPLIPKLRAMPEGSERSRALVVAGRAAAKSGALAKGRGLIEEAAVGAERSGALMALAEVLAEAGDFPAAEKAARDARDAAPGEARPAIVLARVLELAGRQDEAIRELEAVAATGGERRTEVAPQLGDLLIRAGRTAEARALAEKTAGEPGGLAAAAYIRAAVALAEGDDAAAESEYQRMAELLPKSAFPRVLAARVAMRRQAPGRAREALEAALAIEPGHTEAELGLLELDERAGASAAVRARAERLLGDPVARPRAVRALLASYARESDAAGGLARLEELEKRFPNDPTIRVNAAIFRVLAGEHERGLAELARIAEESPDSSAAFALLAQAQESSTDALEAIEELAKVASKDSRFAPARIALARIYERLGRSDLAVRELEGALRDRPDLREARFERARIAARSNDSARAIAELEALHHADPRDGRVLAVLAELKLSSEDATGAAALYEDLVKVVPSNARAHARLGRAYAAAGAVEKALASYERARKLDPRLSEAHEDGLLLLARGEVAGARETLSRALEATSDPRFAAALAVAEAIGGESARAAEHMVAWQARSPRGAEGAIARAMILSLGGDRRGAEAAAATATAPPEVRAAAAAVRPGAGGALDARVRLELEIFAFGAAGWAREVRARAERVAREPAPDALLSWWALRGALAARSEPAVRAALARRLAAAAPGDVDAGLALASAQLDAGDGDGSLATLRGLRERFPESAAVALALGVALERRGDRAGALEQYARAAAAEPASPVALNNYAYLLSTDPAHRAVALACARRAARAAPSSGEILDTLGWILLLDGQVEEAKAALSRAAAAAPANPTIRYHFALALDAAGEPARAANHLEIALLAMGEFPEKDEAKAKLERLRNEVGSATVLAASDAPLLAPGAPFEEKFGAGGISVFRIAPAEGPREARLRFRAPADAPAAVTLFQGERPWKRVEAAAGEEVVLPRLALAPAGHVVAVRRETPAGSAPFSIALEGASPAGPEPREVEPDESAETAGTIAPGGVVSGALDGPADRDCWKLSIPPGGRATAHFTAGARGELRLEVLIAQGSAERAAKHVRVAPGGEVALAGLAAPARGTLVLRVSAGTALARPVGGGATGDAPDYRIRLVAASEAEAAAFDPEPDDRIDDAVEIAAGAAARGSVGPADAADWYRVAAAPGDVLELRLRNTTAGARPPIAFEIWERTPERTLPARRYVLSSEEIALPRWRTPSEGTLFLAVGPAAAPAAAATYELAVRRAAVPEGAVEMEPNDRPALADTVAAGVALKGALDVAGDRDWVRVPALEPGAALSISLKAGPDFAGAVVSVFSRPDRDPRWIASFDASGGALEVPALRLPDGPAALVVAAASGAPGNYELTLSSAPAETALEVEPNDDAASAVDLAIGRSLRGRISGLADRDVIRADGRRPLTVRATGAAPIAVLVRREGAAPQVLAPGASLSLTPEALGGAEGAIVEIYAPREEGAAGLAASFERARAGATYEVISP
jgi:tetratricopeptide (TPR) repeat protein